MNMITDATHVAQHEAARQQAQHGVHAGGEYLTFRLGSEEYGIDILRVQEIRSYETPKLQITPTSPLTRSSRCR